jgi:predicted transcriptional regulator
MIIMALLVLPFLTLEFMWAEEVRQHFALALFLDIGTSTIWLAFAIEFIVMVSVAENKASYSLRHWTDLAVVVLPMLDFLPFLRLMRLGRVLQMQQLTRMSRVYRLRALLMKVWRAALLLEVIQRIFGRSPAARLKRLRDLLAAKEEELAELRLEIEQLERQVQAQAVPVADAAAPAELDRCG